MKGFQVSLICILAFFFAPSHSTKYAFTHFNDVYGQLEKYIPGSETAGPLQPCLENQTCTGGLARIVYFKESLMNDPTDGTNPETRFTLTPGNLVGGENGWLSAAGWDEYAKLVRLFYTPDVMSLGMNEFGAGLSTTLKYVNEATQGINDSIPGAKVVISNVDCDIQYGASSLEKQFCDHENITHGIYPLKQGVIGVLGFVNPDVMKLSSPGKLKFTEVVPTLKQKIINDTKEYKTYVAVGDGSYALAKQILEAIPEIKLVIYGRAFGSSKDMTTGQYPEPYGNSQYIAIAGAYGSSVGKIILDIDDEIGNVKNTSGSTIVKTTALIGDEYAQKNVTYIQQLVENQASTPIGKSLFTLRGGEACWRNECNLGNLVADAMVHCALNNAQAIPDYKLPPGEPVFALWHAGALFQDNVKAREEITKLDIFKWLPFHNRAVFTKIRGDHLLQIFKMSASGITAKTNSNVKDWGQFLQVSDGIEVYYSTSGGDPSVTNIRLLHDVDTTPIMKDINNNGYYYFVIPSFISEGRNVYDFAKDFWDSDTNMDLGFDDDCVEKYVKAMGIVSVGFEERIWIDSNSGPGCSMSSKERGVSSAVTVLVTIVITLILVGVVYVGYVYVLPTITGKRPDGFNSF